MRTAGSDNCSTPRGGTPISIRTCPRPQKYLCDTISSIRESGFSQEIIISAEPETEEIDFWNCTWIHHPKKLGVYDNFIFTLRKLRECGYPWYIICEDDFILQPHACFHIEQAMDYFLGHPEVGVLSPYCAFPYGNRYTLGWRITVREKPGLCGALFLIFNGLFIDKIINVLDAMEHDSRFLDTNIGKCLQSLNLAVVSFQPSLVIHTGEESTVANKRHLNSKSLLLNRSPYLGWSCNNPTS